MTLPPSGCNCLMASKAALPPPSLSLAIADTAYDGSFVGGVDEHHLDPGGGRLLKGLLHGLDVGRCDQQRVRPARDDRIQDWLLQRRIELLRALGVYRDAELGSFLLRTALHGDVELVADHTLQELDVVVLAGLLRCGNGGRRRLGRRGRGPVDVSPEPLDCGFDDVQAAIGSDERYRPYCTRDQHYALTVHWLSLSVLGTPVKVGIRWSFLLFGLVPARAVGAVDRSRGRGGAPAAQRGRTTSRPTRIRRILVGRENEAKEVVVQVICCLP